MFMYGNVTRIPMDVVSLDWKHIPLKDGSLPKGLPRHSGVYAVQGWHDSCSGSSVLYVGQATSLASRLPDSLCERIFWKSKGAAYLYSDVWDVSLYIAELKLELISRVEAALIAAHAPAFNNAGVRSASSIA